MIEMDKLAKLAFSNTSVKPALQLVCVFSYHP